VIRRLYHPDNCAKLIAFGRKWHAQVPQMQWAYSPEKCEKLLKACFMAPDKAVWGSFDKKNKVRGVLIGAIEPFAFMEGSYVMDLVFCAEQDGAQLFRALVQWGKSHGAVAVQLGVTSGIPQAEKFYEAAGLKRVGSIFVQNLEGV
jgi:hypothetical protein